MNIQPATEDEVMRIERDYQAALASGEIQPHQGEPPEWFKDLYTRAMQTQPAPGRAGKFISACKRAWKWFICDHINQCVDLAFDNSTEMRICQGCGRVLWVMDDGDRRHNPHKRDRLAI